MHINDAILSRQCPYCGAAPNSPCVVKGTNRPRGAHHVARLYATADVKKSERDKKRVVVAAIETIAMSGYYPKEAHEMLEAWLEGRNRKPVFHESPRRPDMDDMVFLCREHGRISGK